MACQQNTNCSPKRAFSWVTTDLRSADLLCTNQMAVQTMSSMLSTGQPARRAAIASARKKVTKISCSPSRGHLHLPQVMKT